MPKQPLFPPPQRLAQLVLEHDDTCVEFGADAVRLGEVLRLADGGAFGDQSLDRRLVEPLAAVRTDSAEPGFRTVAEQAEQRDGVQQFGFTPARLARLRRLVEVGDDLMARSEE